MSRRFAALILAVVAATGLLASPAGTTEVRAASPGLTIVTDARYDVQPESHRVRVTLDMVMKNRLSDTKIQRFYFDHAFLSVLPGASAPKLTWSGSGTPRARVTKATTDSTTLRLDFGARIYSGKSASYQLVFDLVDTGGDARRPIRVGDSFVTFWVWAFASDSTPGSTVRVVFPAGYQVQVASRDMPAPTTAADGTVVLQTGGLKAPLTFFAYLVADRLGAVKDTTVAATVGETPVALTISSWAEDAAWGRRVGDLAGRALPVLAERIGLAWPRAGELAIRETAGRSSGGYAGLFDPAAGRIDVAYDASDEVVLHEAAHSWFNGTLLADRWATEAFASYYARSAAPDLKVAIEPGADPDTIPADLEASRIPLNAWGALGDVARPTEDYAYTASLILARAIGARVGDDGLRAVWADAAAGTGAYQPPTSTGVSPTVPETVDGPPDWRGLLDLLDEHTTTSLDDLWRTWVARPEDLALLDARQAARARYAATVANAGEWQTAQARSRCDAGVAVRRREPAADRCRDDPGPANGHRRRRGRVRAGAPGHAPDRIREPGRDRDRDHRGEGRARRDRPLRRGRGGPPGRHRPGFRYRPVGDLTRGRPGRRAHPARVGRHGGGRHLGRERCVGMVERGRRRPGTPGQPRAARPRHPVRGRRRRDLVSGTPAVPTWHDDGRRHRRLNASRIRTRSIQMTVVERGRPSRVRPRARLLPGLGRRLLALLVVVVAAGSLAGTLGVAQVDAASDQLRVAVAATYRVDPPKGVVHVTLDATLTNLKSDTATTLYYYRSVSFGVPLEAISFKATSNGSTLDVSKDAHTTFREISVDYPNLYHGKSRKIRLTYDLPSGKPRSDSPIRVGLSHAAFTAWAWGDPGLGDVRIIMPPDFIATVGTSPTDASAQLVASSVDGRTEYTVKHLDDPIGWYSSIEGSNRDALTDVSIVAAGEPIVIHAWPEDKEWLGHVMAVLKDDLPALEAAIGLPWPVSRDLQVSEVTSSEIDGYAGFFNSSFDQITISEDLDDMVIVHEASHAWFDGKLFQERWIDEGLADEYASRILAADQPGTAIEGPSPVSLTDKAAFDLNTWAPPNRVDSTSAAYEKYGYDASWTVMRAIVDDVTVARMRDVFKAADAQTLTYVGAGPAEASGIVPDWRRFLDLVTDVGRSTKAEGLLERWVLTPRQDKELTARDAARTRYFALVASGGDWLPGVLIRKPMSNWRFDDAQTAMTEAETVISARDALVAATTELGLAMPGELEPAYESADAPGDLTALETRIADWTAAAAAIRTARDDLAKERPPLVALGLFDTDPRSGYDAALTAFAAGDDKAVMAGTAATIAVLDGAETIGRGRATTAGLAAGVVVLLLLLAVIVAVRRRRRRRRSIGQGALAWASASAPDALADDGSGFAAADPYATLAATPDLVDDVETGEPGARGAEPD